VLVGSGEKNFIFSKPRKFLLAQIGWNNCGFASEAIS